VKSKKIILISNTAWNIANFRIGLIRGLVAAGYEVVAVAPPDDHVYRIEALNIRFVAMPMNNKGMNPLEDLVLIARFYFLFRQERPHAILTYTIKPNIYASIAAHLLHIPTINNIAGLGVLFIKKSWATFIAEFLYRVSLKKSKRVFFQNEDDLLLFKKKKLINPRLATHIPGSGIDIAHFEPRPFVRNNKKFVFLLIARLLWDKGIGEFVEAAKKIRSKYDHVECQLLGFLDVQNPSAISRQQLEIWVSQGVVTYLGATDDVRGFINNADCIVLPSYYREGVPHSLLEAASMGKPIITSDNVGCRDVVDDGKNGFLCTIRDSNNLCEKMEQMLNLPLEERVIMGQQGRQKIILVFDEKIVISHYLEAIKS
jgi:glycosyltransferase involved in cell wall biosynthesis